MTRLIDLTLLKLVDGKLIEKQVKVVAGSIATLEKEMLAVSGSLIPVTFIQAAHQGMAFSLNAKETIDVVATKVEQAMLPMFVIETETELPPEVRKDATK